MKHAGLTDANMEITVLPQFNQRVWRSQPIAAPHVFGNTLRVQRQQGTFRCSGFTLYQLWIGRPAYKHHRAIAHTLSWPAVSCHREEITVSNSK